MRSRVLTGLVAAVLASALAACGGSGTAPTTAADGGSTPGAGGPDGSDGSPATGDSTASGQPGQTSVRIGNFYADQNLKPGPALDLYDTPVGQAGTPILTAVAYGSFSAYVHPHETGGIVRMYVLPTGEDPAALSLTDGKGVGGYQDDGSNLQETLALVGQSGNGSSCLGTGPICGLGVSSVVEKGDDANGSTGPVAPAPAAGQAELLVSDGVVSGENLRANGSNVSYYFFVDTSCDPPLNGDAAQEPGLPYVFAAAGSASSEAIFATTPGTHELSVVANSSSQLPPCAGLTPKQGQLSVDLTGVQQALVFIYGTSVTDLHLAVGPIQP